MLAALHQRARVICFLLIFAAAAAYFVFGQLEFNHDSAVYILLSESLISGDGYRSLYIVGSPPHTKYPPLFPLLLAPIVYLFELNFWAMRLFVTVVGVAALYVIYTFFRRIAGDRVAFTILVLTGVSHGVWSYSQQILSEIPYLLFSFLGLLLLERYKEERARILGKACMAALAIALAFLTRNIGLALLVGGGVYIALEGQRSGTFYSRQRLTKSGLLVALAGAPAALWFLRNWVVSGGRTPVAYLQEYGLKDYASVDSRMTGLNDLYELISHNLYIYVNGCSKVVLPYFPWLPDQLTGPLVTTVVLIGFFICAIRKRTILEYYVISYVIAVLLFPAAYPRYLVPLIPIIWYYFLVAAREIIRSLFLRHTPLDKQDISSSSYRVLATVLIISNFSLSIFGGILNRDGDNSYGMDEAEQIVR